MEKNKEEKVEIKEESDYYKNLSIEEKLSFIQSELKVPKSKHNDFGNYNFRNCEDILEAIKPFLAKYGVLILLSDEIDLVGDNTPVVTEEEYFDEESKRMLKKSKVVNTQRYYVKSTVKLVDVVTGKYISNCANAREEDSKKGMDASQITGSASSYARKYALNGLLALDDVKDPDTNEYSKITEEAENVSLEEAEGYIFGFGKHKGKLLKEVIKVDTDYPDWLVRNGKADAKLKKCIEVLKNVATKPKDKVVLLNQMHELEIATNSNHEKILTKYGVNSDSELNIEQLEEIISTLNKFIPSDAKTPYDF